MFKFFKNKLFWLLVITIASVIGIFYAYKPRNDLMPHEKLFNFLVVPLQKRIEGTKDYVSGSIYSFSHAQELTVQVKNLQKQVDTLAQEKMRLQNLDIENKRLYDLLKIRSKYSNFEQITCQIIFKDPGNWFEVFTIDKGSNDGISVNMPVVNSKGVVGQVISVDSESSKVMSLIDSNASVSARLTKSRDLVVVRGDLTAKESGLLKMIYLPAGVNIKVGDIIETSGIGGIYPAGRLIGEVSKVENEMNHSMMTVYVKPAVDFKSLEELIVLKKK